MTTALCDIEVLLS